MKRTIAIAAAALCASAALVPVNAAAQTDGQWKWDGAIYVYLPTVGGKTTFPQPTAGSDVSIDSSKIMDSLKGAFMGSLGAHNGQWVVFTDLMYLDLGNSKSATRDIKVGRVELPLGASADAKFDLTGTIWTLGGSYRVVSKPEATMDLLAGARMLNLKQSLGWTVSGNIGPIALPGRSGNLDTKVTNWDAIVGVKGRLLLGDEKKWFVPYYVDVGTGNSDLTWQAMTGVGYKFSWGEVLGAWRYVDYKLKSKPIEDVNLNGPLIAAIWHW
jgi:hypothetical protein